ncbi:hypothetical protein BKA65DRAFT_531172 [Rhexocercosporidium sp. MPI-PUGE-AT-0058]|nr:hypothetical protein BKA65DRAFT_531172 [Rhexocercosporidium sp. MPI-PUGE-AT-0058]
MKQALLDLGKSQSEVIDKLTSIGEGISQQNDIFGDAESEISRHHKRTFEWILEHEHKDVQFINWLRHGYGTFHFAGKPGSGKSTLFKFMVNHNRVIQNLEEWASLADKQLVLSKFFFWGLGSNDQKSVPGLIRGLLSEICTSNSSITKLIFPNLWGKRGFCFFIDGLDEFNGTEMTHWKLSRMLLDWAQLPAGSSSPDSFLKICVSSREDHSIMTVFQNSPQVRLQDITKGDMSALVEDSLLRNEYFHRLQTKAPIECQELINSILEGADGVFLWVSLLLNMLE